MLIPDLGIYSTLKKNKYKYLDIYALFGQFEFIKLFYERGGKDGGKDPEIDYLKTAVLLEIATRIKGLVLFAKKLRNQQRYLWWREKIKKTMCGYWKCWDYEPEQFFLAYLLGFLNKFMSIVELIRDEIDESLGTRNLSDDLEHQEWFHFADAMRQACQHEETPLLNIKGNEIELMFTRFHKLYPRHQTRFKWIAEQERHVIGLDCSDIEYDLLEYLEQWAKKHLERIDSSETITIIKKLRSKGKPDFIKINLGDVMTKLDARQSVPSED